MNVFIIILFVVGFCLEVSYQKDTNGTSFNFKLKSKSWMCLKVR